MNGSDQRPRHASVLRRQAEALAGEEWARSPVRLEALTSEQVLARLQSLRVREIEVELQTEELRRLQAEVESVKARYQDLYESAPVGYCTLDEHGRILQANLAVAALLGVNRSELVGQPITDHVVRGDHACYRSHAERLLATGAPQVCELRIRKSSGADFSARLDATLERDADGVRISRLVINDITAHQLQEEEQALTSKLMSFVITPASFDDCLTDLIDTLQRWSGCEAVGIRLRADGDYPYAETRGFSSAFVADESRLCGRGPAGEVLRDGECNPVLKCVCGSVLRGRFDPSQPFFTEYGSFWTNSISALLANMRESDRQVTARSRCCDEQYESLALIPMRAGGEVHGLLQFNDHRPHRFSPELIAKFERMAKNLALALSRREAEVALQESELLFHALADCAPVGIYRTDAEGQCTYVNPAWSKVADLSPGEARGRGWLKGLHSEERDSIGDQWRASVQSGGSWGFEYRFQQPSGTERWVYGVAAPIRSSDGGVTGYVGVNVDITERRLAENALREAESRLRTIFGASPVAIWEEDFSEVKSRFDELGAAGITDFRSYFEEHPEEVATLAARVRILQVNDRSVELLGAADAEHLIRDLPNYFTVDSLEAFKEELIALAKGEREFHTEISIVDCRGEPRLLELTLSVPTEHAETLSVVLVSFLDITERKRMEQALRDSEQLHRTTIASISDAVMITDDEGRLTYTCPNTDLIFGPEGLSARGNISSVFKGAIFDPDALMKEGELRNIETTVTDTLGHEHWLLVNVKRVQINKGTILYTCRDVTEHRQAQVALRESEERFEQLFDHMADGVAVYQAVDDGQDFTFVEMNAAAESLGGVSLNQAIGRRVSELVPEVGTIGLLDVFRRVWRTGCAEHHPLTKQKDGRIEQWVENYVYRLPSGLLVAVSSDTSDERRTAEVLRRSEQRIRGILETALDGFWLVDLQGRLLEVNDTYCRMSGYSAEELCSMRVPDLEFVETKSDAAAHIQKVVEQGQDLFESRQRRKDGTVFDVEVGVQYQPIDGGRLVAFLRDITERKRAEEERAKLEGRLQQAQKMESVGRLAGGVAHDFNNMLGIIMGHAQLALFQPRVSQSVRADLEEILKAAQRSADLTSQLLAFARKQQVTPEILDVNGTVSGMLKMLRRLIGEDIELRFLPGHDLGPIKMDPSQIDQVLVNLCVNARDAMVDGGNITIETRAIRVNEASIVEGGVVPGDYVELVVSDDGCGMGEETASHLFEPFFTTKEVGEGTGLGLATLYGIVKQNHGFVTVRTAQGAGTTLTVSLPRFEGPAAQAPTVGSAGPVGRGHETILVVEDESALLKLTRKVLEQGGYAVLGAATPREAIRIAESHRGEIDLVITDVVMPGMNGRELATKLRSLYPRVRQLFMSGYTADVIAVHGVLDDGTHFLQKPFSVGELATKVREALGR
jgi:PAS domain S-box-containing protein